MPEFDAPVAPAPVSDQPAVDLPSMSVGGPVAGKGPGWWSPLKSKVMALGQQVKAVQASVRPDSAPESHEGEIPTVMRSGAVAVPEEQVGTVLRPPSEAASGEGEVGTVLRSPAEPGDPAASENEIGTVLRSPAELGDPAAVENQIGTVLRPPIRVSGATAVARPIPEAPKPGGKAAVAPVPLGLAEERMVLVERDPNELSLWDHYGIADDDGGVKLDPMATRTEQLAQLLGASTVPAVKVLSSAAVLGVTILVIIILSGRLLSMENLFAIVPATPTPTPTEVAPEPEPEPTPEPEPEPEPEGPVTPSMEPGAKECDPGVWAGQQTSCALANQVATQVGRDITETTVVEAFSSSSNRNYRLECVAGQGITCTGLDDVQGVYVWLVTEN